MNTNRFPPRQLETLGQLFSRTFESEFLFEFLVDDDLLVMNVLMLFITNPEGVDSSALKAYAGSKKWMEMAFTAIEFTNPNESLVKKFFIAAKLAIHFRESMSAEAWFEFVSEPGKKLRNASSDLIGMYVEILTFVASKTSHPTIMVDLLGLSIPKSDLLYYSGPFPGALLGYVSGHPDVVGLFKSGAPSKQLAQLAIKHQIWGLGALLNIEDRGQVFTQELGV